MKKLLIIFLMPVFMFTQEYEYSLQDYNATSPTYEMDVWNPEYSGFITMHFFSSQGWAGWTSTFGQLSNFQDELRNQDGYENVVIIAVGQSNTSGFNSSFCGNSDLPLVIDSYPSLPIRAQFGETSFNEFHKRLFIIGHNGEYLGDILLNSLSNASKNYIRGIIEENYQEESLLGDVNGDTLINVQDIVLIVNLVLSAGYDSAADLNSDGITNVLDIVQIVNIILS